MLRFHDERDWFIEDKFGMFVHWGIYSVGGFHEQEMFRRNIPRKAYEKYMQQFNPVGFDPDAWLDLAEEAGMKYITFTTKHIDGFCMWNTQYTDYNIMNTPYKKDILGMLAEACRRRKIPLCLYYSCADMHHPNYPNHGRSYELLQPDAQDRPDMTQYMAYVRNQLTELCTQYGEIHGIFWDANMPHHYDPSINDMIRRLQPKAVINDRGYDQGDYGTPERDYQKKTVDAFKQFEKITEACQAVGMESWGYKKDENFYSSKYLMQSIAKIMAMGGNYLLNVGPKPDGTIQQEFAVRLKEIGKWYHAVREAYIGAEPASQLIRNEGVLATRKDETLYLHFIEDPAGTSVMLDPIAVLPKRAVLLNNGQELTVRRDQGVRTWSEPMEYVRICGIPVGDFHNSVMVIKLEYDKIPDTVLKNPELEILA